MPPEGTEASLHAVHRHHTCDFWDAPEGRDFKQLARHPTCCFLSMRKPAAAVSLALHVLVAILLFSITFPHAIPSLIPRHVELLAPRLPRPLPAKDSGGGGQRQPLPEKRGRLPEVVRHRVYVPPMVSRPETPKLVVIQAMADAPAVNISAPDIGSPFGASGIVSGGFGGPVGIGKHGNGGIGDRDGPGSGGPGGPGGDASHARVTRGPQVIYQEEPEYSDEARKARQQGTVLLAIDVDTSGRAVNIRVIRGLGLGLDERAIESVGRWKFRPGMVGDRPVKVGATVAVTFHLL